MNFRTVSELVHVAVGPGLPRDLDRDRCDPERKLLFSGDAPSSRSTVAHKEAHGRWASAGHSLSRKKNNYKQYGSCRSTDNLEEQARHAVAEISEGVHSNQFKKVYQGLKLLHQIKIDHDKYSMTEFSNKDNYVSEKLEEIYRLFSHNDYLKSNLEKFYKEPEKIVKKHSDRNKLFYRLIDSLNRFGLITKRYFESQIKPISDMDALITQSLDSLRKKHESRREIFEMSPGLFYQSLNGEVSGREKFSSEDYKRPENIFTPKSLLEHFSKIYSQHHGDFLMPKTWFSTARQLLYTEGAKLVFHRQAESSEPLIDDRPLPEACEARSYEISNRVEKFTGSATAAGLFSKILEHPGWNDFFAEMTTVINNAGNQVTFEVASENNGDSVVTQMPAPHNQDSIDHTAEKLNKNPKFTFLVAERPDHYTFTCVADIISPSIRYSDNPETIQYFKLANEGEAEDVQLSLKCRFDISREAALKGEIEILDSGFFHAFKWKLD